MKTFWALFAALVAVSVGMTVYESPEPAAGGVTADGVGLDVAYSRDLGEPTAASRGGVPDSASFVIDNNPVGVPVTGVPDDIPAVHPDDTPIPIGGPRVAANPIPTLDALLGIEAVELAEMADAGPAAPDLAEQLTELEAVAREEDVVNEQAAVAVDANPANPDDLAATVAEPTLMLNEYPVTGTGTADDPYAVGWPLLESISRQYAPRMGLTTLPDWVKDLDGKHVRVDGFIMLPMTGATDEVLAMRYQWDGCCLGLPPTPYNAVEVRLEESLPPTMIQQHAIMNYGRLEGTFKVDPYVLSNYLMGLWIMEDATLTMTADSR